MRQDAGEQRLLLEELALDALTLAHLRLEERVERAHALLGLLQLDVALLELPHLGAQAEEQLHLALEPDQAAQLGLRERPGAPVDDAEETDGETLLRLDAQAREEADARLALDERMGGEALIGQGVIDDEEALVVDRLGAEGEVALHLAHAVKPHVRPEPLPFAIHHADERDGRAARLRGEPDEIVVTGLGRRIEKAGAIECPRALCFISLR